MRAFCLILCYYDLLSWEKRDGTSDCPHRICRRIKQRPWAIIYLVIEFGFYTVIWKWGASHFRALCFFHISIYNIIPRLLHLLALNFKFLVVSERVLLWRKWLLFSKEFPSWGHYFSIFCLSWYMYMAKKGRKNRRGESLFSLGKVRFGRRDCGES